MYSAARWERAEGAGKVEVGTSPPLPAPESFSAAVLRHVTCTCAACGAGEPAGRLKERQVGAVGAAPWLEAAGGGAHAMPLVATRGGPACTPLTMQYGLIAASILRLHALEGYSGFSGCPANAMPATASTWVRSA